MDCLSFKSWALFERVLTKALGQIYHQCRDCGKNRTFLRATTKNLGNFYQSKQKQMTQWRFENFIFYVLKINWSMYIVSTLSQNINFGPKIKLSFFAQYQKSQKVQTIFSSKFKFSIWQNFLKINFSDLKQCFVTVCFPFPYLRLF